MSGRPASMLSERPLLCSVSFLKIADRPRFAMICTQGGAPRPRTDFGPVDLTRSFGFEVPSPQRARRVAKACRNLVSPLAQVVGSVTWIDERGMAPVQQFLLAYRNCLSIRLLQKSRFLRMFGHLTGGAAGRRVWDGLLRPGRRQSSSCHAWSPDVHGRQWVLYTMRERDPGSSRFKFGISCTPLRRAAALNARGCRTVRAFTSKAVAYAVEQGLHGLLHRYQDRRPRCPSVHGGDTEWYRPAARRLLGRAVDFFSDQLEVCVQLRRRGITACTSAEDPSGGAESGRPR